MDCRFHIQPHVRQYRQIRRREGAPCFQDDPLPDLGPRPTDDQIKAWIVQNGHASLLLTRTTLNINHKRARRLTSEVIEEYFEQHARVEPTEHDKQKIAGFFDGDGSVIVHIGSLGVRGAIRIDFTQACAAGEAPELEWIVQRWSVGVIRKSKQKPPLRNLYSLNFTVASPDHPLLQVLLANSVIKYAELRTAEEFLRSDRRRPTTDEYKARLRGQRDRNHEDHQWERVTAAYVAGLTIAEGSFSLRNIKICQAGCIPLLHQINEKFPWGGRVGQNSIFWGNRSNMLSYIDTIGPFLDFGQKVPQRNLLAAHLRDTEYMKRGSVWRQKYDERKKQMSALKRL